MVSHPRSSGILRHPDRLPVGWWGPRWDAPRRQTIVEMIRDGVMDPSTGALLWTLVESGRSLTVAAGPSGAGKTTLLTSVLAAIPESRPRYVVRGVHERFADLSANLTNLALLVNEISPHLPIYAWGPVVRQVLDYGTKGCQVLSTIHARTTEEIVGQLAGPPLRLPLRSIAALSTIAFLDAEGDGARRVNRLQSLAYDADTAGLRVSEVDRSGLESALVERRVTILHELLGRDKADDVEIGAAMRAAR